MTDLSAMGLGLIDYAIFAVALVAVLIIGIVSGGKIKDLKDYALSKEKKFSTPVLAMTLIVTMIGSNSSIGAITEIHKDGIIYPLYLTIRLLGVFFLIQYAMHFMVRRYSTAISLYGIIEQEYGAFSAKFSSTLSALYSVAVLSIQMIGMGYITKIFLGIPFNLGVIGTGVVFIIYSSISGIRGVVYTDVLQFFIILIVFPILVGVIVYNVGDLKAVFTNLPQEKMLVLEHKNFTEYTYLSLFWLMPFEFLQATVIQRILMCKDGKEIQRMGLSWVLFSSVFIFMVTILGLASIKLVPSYITGKEVITVLMRDFLPIGLKGVAITAFLAVIMSSADSVLNAATVLVAEITMSQKEREEQQQNGFQFSAKDELTEKEKKKKESFWLKISSVLLGSMSMAFALLDFSFIKVITIGSAIAFTAVNIPVFFAPFKDRRQKAVKAYLGSVVMGLGSFLTLWVILGRDKMYMISFFASLFAIAGWFIGANFFDKIKTNFWARIWEAYAPKAKASKGRLIKTTQGG
jgi:SSS family solute:Na+ symporter